MLKALVILCSLLSRSVSAQDYSCSESPQAVAAPHDNPWSSLTADEVDGINAALTQQFNLSGNNGSSWDSFVYQLYLLNPAKEDVVQFLDGNGSAPERYARATVFFGVEDIHWQEYSIGPLPVTNGTTAEPLTDIFHNTSPGKTKVPPLYSQNDALSFLTQFSSDYANVTMKLWNTTGLEGQLAFRFGIPFWEENGRIISWSQVDSNPSTNQSSDTILPRGISVKFDFTSRNWTDWKPVGWWVAGTYYDSTAEFVNAVFSSNFTVPPPVADGNWTSTDQQGPPLPLDDQPPPYMASGGSARFNLDSNQSYVSWMDFSMYFSVSKDLGLGLYDIQYKGQRLLYELTLQEAYTAYAGSDPFQSQNVYFDSATGMATSFVPLVPGYDCPSYATFINATWTEGPAVISRANAICIFEADADFPIRRHSVAQTYTSAAKNIYFTVRTISTVGNYDFLIDYRFYYDGSIETSVRASGYISATYWDGNGDYGFHIHDYLSGSLHDHVLTWKADFDVLGTDNSVQKVEVVPVTTSYPWSNGIEYNTFKVNRSFVANEDESSINWGQNNAEIYAIVNKDQPNQYGEFPGYRIKRSSGESHLTPQNSTNNRKAGAYTTHDFYVTKYNVLEPRAADPANQFQPGDPLVDFAQFFNGESLDQEDVVLWFNLGMHHLPHTGDLPNTMFTAAHSSMRFEPLNYLDGDPSVQINQQIRINHNTDDSIQDINEFGKMVSNNTCAP